MSLMKKIVVVVAVVWLLVQTARNLIISYVDMMRSALGKDGKPVSLAVFAVGMTVSVVFIGFMGALIAVLKNY